MEQLIITLKRALNYSLAVLWIFWAGETLFFIWNYGFHFAAATVAEKYCDHIFSVGMDCWFKLFVAYYLVKGINYILK